jgi:hypothetical protein
MTPPIGCHWVVKRAQTLTFSYSLPRSSVNGNLRESIEFRGISQIEEGNDKLTTTMIAFDMKSRVARGQGGVSRGADQLPKRPSSFAMETTREIPYEHYRHAFNRCSTSLSKNGV